MNGQGTFIEVMAGMQMGKGLVSYLSPDLVEMRVNSVAASMPRSRFTCCSSPCTASGAL